MGVNLTKTFKNLICGYWNMNPTKTKAIHFDTNWICKKSTFPQDFICLAYISSQCFQDIGTSENTRIPTRSYNIISHVHVFYLTTECFWSVRNGNVQSHRFQNIIKATTKCSDNFHIFPNKSSKYILYEYQITSMSQEMPYIILYQNVDYNQITLFCANQWMKLFVP